MKQKQEAYKSKQLAAVRSGSGARQRKYTGPMWKLSLSRAIMTKPFALLTIFLRLAATARAAGAILPYFMRIGRNHLTIVITRLQLPLLASVPKNRSQFQNLVRTLHGTVLARTLSILTYLTCIWYRTEDQSTQASLHRTMTLVPSKQ